MINQLNALFERDLKKLRKEVALYHDEADLWIVVNGISNSAGTLALHLAGNLRHFIGSVLGQTGYIRDRQAEFNDRNVPRQEILERLNLAHAEVTEVLDKLDPKMLDQRYPLDVFGHEMTTGYFLVHLHGHLNYHLGQVNYHRRILTKQS